MLMDKCLAIVSISISIAIGNGTETRSNGEWANLWNLYFKWGGTMALDSDRVARRGYHIYVYIWYINYKYLIACVSICK